MPKAYLEREFNIDLFYLCFTFFCTTSLLLSLPNDLIILEKPLEIIGYITLLIIINIIISAIVTLLFSKRYVNIKR